jgi:hypothetical protein
MTHHAPPSHLKIFENFGQGQKAKAFFKHSTKRMFAPFCIVCKRKKAGDPQKTHENDLERVGPG